MPDGAKEEGRLDTEPCNKEWNDQQDDLMCGPILMQRCSHWQMFLWHFLNIRKFKVSDFAIICFIAFCYDFLVFQFFSPLTFLLPLATTDNTKLPELKENRQNIWCQFRCSKGNCQSLRGIFSLSPTPMPPIQIQVKQRNAFPR